MSDIELRDIANILNGIQESIEDGNDYYTIENKLDTLISLMGDQVTITRRIESTLDNLQDNIPDSSKIILRIEDRIDEIKDKVDKINSNLNDINYNTQD